MAKSRLPQSEIEMPGAVRQKGSSKAKTFAAELYDMKMDSPDVIYPEFKLFLEGIEIPFESITITETFGDLPSAVIQVPPFAGLQEIGRGYSPKVHVFFRDVEFERYLNEKRIKYTEKDVYRLKFSGVVKASSYDRADSASTAYSSINFTCRHAYSEADNIFMKFGARTFGTYAASASDAAAVVSSYANSRHMVLQAMAPIKPFSASDPDTVDAYIATPENDRPQALSGFDISKVPSYMQTYYNRVLGVPGFLVAIWNTIRLDSYRAQASSKIMTDMYVPLVEQGLRMFQRMSGHYSLEKRLSDNPDKVDEPIRVDEKNNAISPAFKGAIVTPPLYKNMLGAVSRTMLAVNNMHQVLTISGENQSLTGILTNILHSINYDRTVLSSPVQSSYYHAQAVDTIVKPVMPLYFSPTCNVITPAMCTGLYIKEDFDSTPTRLFADHNTPLAITPVVPFCTIRTPVELHKALKRGFNNINNLADTTIPTLETYSSIEEGRGVRSYEAKLSMMSTMVRKENIAGGGVDSPSDIDEFVKGQKQAWFDRNRPKYDTESFAKARERADHEFLDSLNPWEEKENGNGVEDFQRNMFLELEYEFAIASLRTRTGSVTMVFNPYIIAGYPADIISNNFVDPSYHVFITSVTTQISAHDVQTTAQFVSAMTYEEMNAFELPSTMPWLQASLGLDKAPSLSLKNEDPSSEVNKLATSYYMDVLGVGMARPDALYDFEEMRGKTPILDYGTGSFLKGHATYNRDHYGNKTQESLNMIRREIESMADIERTSSVKELDLPPEQSEFTNTPGVGRATGLTFVLNGPTHSVSAIRKDGVKYNFSDFIKLQKFFSGRRRFGKSQFLVYSDDPDHDDNPYRVTEEEEQGKPQKPRRTYVYRRKDPT